MEKCSKWEHEMKDYIKVFIVFFFVWCAFLSTARPYWNKYWLELQLEAASVYGTKNSIKDTRNFLSDKMDDEGFNFKGDDFIIEKDENNKVSISITYADEISIFGLTLKELRFTAERSSYEVKEYY
jgi:hypothetical protein